MKIILLLISISVLVAIIFLAFFIWAVKSGQYEDTYGPSIRILLDDETKKSKGKTVGKSVDGLE